MEKDGNMYLFHFVTKFDAIFKFEVIKIICEI